MTIRADILMKYEIPPESVFHVNAEITEIITNSPRKAGSDGILNLRSEKTRTQIMDATAASMDAKAAHERTIMEAILILGSFIFFTSGFHLTFERTPSDMFQR